MRILVVSILALMTAACGPEQQDVTGSTPACPARLYSAYNPKDLNQCVNACKSCDRGTTVTCTTSCTLHGAR
jgi:hypothetical protein